MKKGQIFSLDFLISLVAVTAAIGLLIQAVEINTYAQKEEREFQELKAVAETAADLIVAGNETTCRDPVTKLRFMNCVVSAPGKFTDIKKFLEDAGYGYSITASFAGEDIDETRGLLGEEDFYEAKRQITINSKSNGPTDLKVRVWKA